MRLRAALAVCLFLGSASAAAAEDPVGIWNLKIRVGKVGQGLRTVLLKVDRAGETLTAHVSGLSNELRPADRFSFERDTMVVEYGAYTYKLKLQGNQVRGTVSSPSGSQEVEGTRQETLSFFGDTPEPFAKEWTGVLGPRSGPPPQDERDPAAWVKSRISSPNDLVLWMRRTSVDFTNAPKFSEALLQHAGRTVSIAGTWRTDRIEIDQIKPVPARPR
jgi:hypothetical protein